MPKHKEDENGRLDTTIFLKNEKLWIKTCLNY